MLFTIHWDIVVVVILLCYAYFRMPATQPPIESAYYIQRRALAHNRALKPCTSQPPIGTTDPPPNLPTSAEPIEQPIDIEPIDLPIDSHTSIEPIDPPLDLSVCIEPTNEPTNTETTDSHIDLPPDIEITGADDAAVEEFKQSLNRGWLASSSQEHVLWL